MMLPSGTRIRNKAKPFPYTSGHAALSIGDKGIVESAEDVSQDTETIKMKGPNYRYVVRYDRFPDKSFFTSEWIVEEDV